MGGGQKRGRTQRRHFKQSRENVWKLNPKKTRPDADEPDADAKANANPKWEPFATQNPGFDEYYKEQGIVPEDEWDDFISLLRKPLPAAFRINASGQFFQDIRSQLENDFMKSLQAEVTDDYEAEAIRPLSWYPGNIAWHLNFSRMQLRKNQALERFHEFLKQENEIGNITRQEAVSMVPPLFLDVLPDHHILDMCAAPGSKTFQLLEIMHQSIGPGVLPNGLVIANDVDVQRCNLLIHQTKRMSTANLIVTNHEAQHFPSCSLKKGQGVASEGQEEHGIHTLEFDRVLCDVPCSGDGTLRKAPDIWRKWNAGMGNGLHRLQVEIAMRGLALLKVGGRMVYSTCSLNPVENEAVVAEVLRRSRGSVELLDVSNELPELVRRPGLNTWKVRDRGVWLTSYKDVPLYRRSVILPSMFPSGQSCKENHTLCNDVQKDVKIVGNNLGEETVGVVVIEQDQTNTEHQNSSDDLSSNTIPLDTVKAAAMANEVSKKSIPPEELDKNSIAMEVSGFPLHYCMRIVPHDQNSGAFFIAVLQKMAPLHVPENHASEPAKFSQVSENTSENPEDENEAEERISGQVSIQAEENTDTNVLEEQLKSNLSTKNACSTANNKEEVVKCDGGKSGHMGIKDVERKGKWRGVDPVVFFTDEKTINSILSFYGINDAFPLYGHLVTRNSDANHVKRIYYISNSVQEVLQLNDQVGQRLKITSLGLKIFERQTSKDGSTCAFRLSSEGLPLLLPYISKQILFASLADFQHLLQYRTIKFPDFVDSKFGEEASDLVPGCCVVVLREGNRSTDSTAVDASTVAIVCWKGKTNISIMVSPLDGKELLERLAFRFGIKSISLEENKKSNMEIEGVSNLEDVEPIATIETDNQEIEH
ncbi:tRNA (cytosine(34)-C(5))-methyltransferase-like isoform X2 [Ananas comosus]|uniref:tRNA (Cytosine(34)-C(5))-methyltransferase-like isoform X2 n=1 Tax=Ananas comosus TaxID=4615 RepID=A0A6P5H3X8_ANACO|nr:tRNA (cytosine(34)-C(5))-methyltransferase-like isoform X2 [Ananas comosus]